MDRGGILCKILEVYKTCGIDSFPVNSIEVIQTLGIPLFKYSELPSRKELECHRVSDDAFKLKGSIYYNDTFPHICRQRFTLMHEVGHILLDHAGDTMENDLEADFFASNILAPRILIHRLKCYDAALIHGTFGLSYAASNRALLSYREWFRKISYSAARRPSDTELQLDHMVFPNPSCLSTNSMKPSATRSRLSRDTEECIDFFDELQRNRGNTYWMERAKSQWLYANDL